MSLSVKEILFFINRTLLNLLIFGNANWRFVFLYDNDDDDDCIVLYSNIYIAPLNSHRQTEALLVRLAPRKETSFKK